MYTQSRGISGVDFKTTSRAKNNDGKKILLGALAGAAVGSLVGSLFTKKGVETRSRISNRSKKIASNIQDQAADITSNLKDKVAGIGEQITDKLETSKEVAVKVFKKNKSKGSNNTYSNQYSTYQDETVEISTAKVLLALLGAASVGTAVWSLTTDKGKQTRKRVVSSSMEIAGNLKEQVTGLAQGLSEKYKDAKQGAEDLLRENSMDNSFSKMTGKNTTPGNSYLRDVTP